MKASSKVFFPQFAYVTTLLMKERLLSDLRLADLLQDALQKEKELLAGTSFVKVYPIPLDSLQENRILASDFKLIGDQLKFYYFSLSTANLTQSVLSAFDLKARLDAQISLNDSPKTRETLSRAKDTVQQPDAYPSSTIEPLSDALFQENFLQKTHQSVR